MNANDWLKRQHREVLSLFDALEKSAHDKKARREVLGELGGMLRAHFAVEERVYYPAAEQWLGEGGAQIVLDSFEEHAVSKFALDTLESTRLDDKRFAARSKMLRTLFERHRDEEENVLMPRLDSVAGAEALDKLGDKLQSRFSAVQRAARPAPAGRRAPAVGRGRRARAAATPGRPREARGRRAAAPGGVAPRGGRGRRSRARPAAKRTTAKRSSAASRGGGRARGTRRGRAAPKSGSSGTAGKGRPAVTDREAEVPEVSPRRGSLGPPSDAPGRGESTES